MLRRQQLDAGPVPGEDRRALCVAAGGRIQRLPRCGRFERSAGCVSQQIGEGPSLPTYGTLATLALVDTTLTDLCVFEVQ